MNKAWKEKCPKHGMVEIKIQEKKYHDIVRCPYCNRGLMTIPKLERHGLKEK